MSIALYRTDPSIPSIFYFLFILFWKESQEMMLQQDGNPWGASCSPQESYPPSLLPHHLLLPNQGLYGEGGGGVDG